MLHLCTCPSPFCPSSADPSSKFIAAHDTSIVQHPMSSSPPSSPPAPHPDRIPATANVIGRYGDHRRPDSVEYLDGGALAAVPLTGVKAMRRLIK